MRYLIVGDIHGDLIFASRMSKLAKREDISIILQCGDMGVWSHFKDGVYFLDTLNENLKGRGQTLRFVPGNHENWDVLDELEKTSERTTEGFCKLRSNIHYIPKVHSWNEDGVSFMGVGGAVSVDKNWRLAQEKEPHTLWWPQEQLTVEDTAKVMAAGQADILLTHDCPTNAPFPNRLKPDLDSQIHRQKMNVIGQSVKPKIWLHGHMHDWMDYEFRHDAGTARVIGLECNDRAMSPYVLNQRMRDAGPGDDIYNYVILDSETLKVSGPGLR